MTPPLFPWELREAYRRCLNGSTDSKPHRRATWRETWACLCGRSTNSKRVSDPISSHQQAIAHEPAATRPID